MIAREDTSSSSDEGQSVNDFEVDKSQEMLRNNLIQKPEDKWVFPNPRNYLGTILGSGVVRPLSPTLKEHSLESVFPGVVMLYEGFDNMREWKNTIEFVGFHARQGKKKNLFDSRHHWDMRTKFLEVRLRCMDKIVEDPFPQRQSESAFFLRVPSAVEKAVEKKANNAKQTSKDSAVELKKFEANELSVYTSHFKGQNCAQQEVINAVEPKDNVQVEKSFEEKLHRQSLQKELNVECRKVPETLSTSNDNEVDNCRDLLVIGKAIANPCLTQGGDIETVDAKEVDEMVLEDVNDKDDVPDVILPSSCKLGLMPAGECNGSQEPLTSEVREKQEIAVSRFQRLRRRIRALLSCFGNNKVTHVDV